jgi:hypothetical protein
MLNEVNIKTNNKKNENFNHLVADSRAFFPAALTAALPASLDALSTKTVPHNLMPRPNVPVYCNSRLATMAARSNNFQTFRNKISV